MASSADFHEKPFDEKTETKLQIFELYARQWLPVFLAQLPPPKREIHIFDFFAGPGADSVGTPGSPLRLLRQLALARQKYQGWSSVRVVAHFYDDDDDKIVSLRRRVRELAPVPGLDLDIDTVPFSDAFSRSQPIFNDRRIAKLALLDQYGVEHVTDTVFSALVAAPTCDFLFFVSSSTLNRFRNHPAIKQKITRPEDPHHVHRAAMDYYRSRLPAGGRYYLAPFSIKKGPNIYGLIFGSAHPLGMAKFLDVAWSEDEINGEADFDIHRDNVIPDQPRLFEPTKLGLFKDELEGRLRAGLLNDELAVLEVCFRHGVRPQHAADTLARLKSEGVIECAFRVPGVRTKNLKEPRPISFKAR